MPRLFCVTVLVTSGLLIPRSASPQPTPPLDGVWTFDRSLSDIPPEIGFNINLPGTEGGGAAESGSSRGGGRGRRATGGGGGRVSPGGFSAPRESYDDARRLQLLTAEARKPAARLMIVDTGSAVTITNELGQSRTFHPTGREESIDLEGVPASVTAARDGDRLVVLYHVEQNRDLRWTYSRSTSPSQLAVEVEFLEHGSGDKEKLIYEPGVATETSAAAPTAPRPAGAGAPTPASPAPAKPAAPDSFDQRPGAELRGIKTLGIVVEDLRSEATGCGLNRSAIEDAVAKRLDAGGFTVRRNSDDDTYVYVNIMTAATPNGGCLSRYDLFLYTQATANVSYHTAPVLVQASLFHRGGIASTAAGTHAAAVVRGLENYADLMVAAVHDANK